MKIGDKLYKYLSFNGFGEYIVIAIKKLKKCTMYEIECQACTDHEKCTMYVIKERGKEQYRFVVMTTDEETADEQHIWHDDDIFYSNLIDARKAKYIKSLKSKRVEIERTEERLKFMNEEYTELQQHYENIK